MNCEEIYRLIIKHFDEGLNQEENSILTQHFEVCEKCKMDFEKFSKMFQSLDKENEQLLYSKEAYLQSIDVLEIVHRKKKKKFLPLVFNPALSLATFVLVAIGIFLYLYNQPSNKINKTYVEQNINNGKTVNPIYDDDFSFYLNQDYIIEGIEITDIDNSDYFNDAIKLLREVRDQVINNFFEEQSFISNIDNLDKKELDDIIAQLEMKKF